MKDALEWKVSKRFLGKKKKTPKKENYKKQGRDQPPKWLVQHGLWYPGEQKRGSSGTLEP